MTIRAIRNHILFQFVDEVKNINGKMGFAETTDWGFEISAASGSQAFDDSSKRARFGVVKSVGHEVPKDIQPGMVILIEPLKWTNAISYNNEKYWRTDSDHVLATANSL